MTFQTSWASLQSNPLDVLGCVISDPSFTANRCVPLASSARLDHSLTLFSCQVQISSSFSYHDSRFSSHQIPFPWNWAAQNETFHHGTNQINNFWQLGSINQDSAWEPDHLGQEKRRIRAIDSAKRWTTWRKAGRDRGVAEDDRQDGDVESGGSRLSYLRVRLRWNKSSKSDSWVYNFSKWSQREMFQDVVTRCALNVSSNSSPNSSSHVLSVESSISMQSVSCLQQDFLTFQQTSHSSKSSRLSRASPRHSKTHCPSSEASPMICYRLWFLPQCVISFWRSEMNKCYIIQFS